MQGKNSSLNFRPSDKEGLPDSPAAKLSASILESPSALPTSIIATKRRRPPIIIACVANKGGVGKTTAVLCEGFIFSQLLGLRVLLVDGDFQASLTGLIEPRSVEKAKEFYAEHGNSAKTKKRINLAQIFSELIFEEEPRPFSKECTEAQEVELSPIQKYENFFYIPGHRDIYRLDNFIEVGFGGGEAGKWAKQFPGAMTNMFREIGQLRDIDIVIIDLSPSPSGFNKAVLWGADYFFTPYFPEPLSYNTLQILGDCLEDGAKRYKLPAERERKQKEADRRERGEDLVAIVEPENKLGKISYNPKFLGGIAQDVVLAVRPKNWTEEIPSDHPDNTLLRRPYREPAISQTTWLENSQKYLGNELKQKLQKYNLISPHYKPLDCYKPFEGKVNNVVVSRLNSEYIDGQEQGVIVIDPTKTIKHETKSHRTAETAPKVMANRQIHLAEFACIAGGLLHNMLEEDIAFLESRQPEIRKLIPVLCNVLTNPIMANRILDFMNAVREALKKTSGAETECTSKESVQTLLPEEFHEDYPDEDIHQLAEHYLLNLPNSVLLNHLQIGHHIGNTISGENTEEGLTAQLTHDIEAHPTVKYFFIPVGIGNSRYQDAGGGGHWTLLYAIRQPDNSFVCRFFDPLGNKIPEILKNACLRSFPNSQLASMRNLRVQGYDNTCGVWVAYAIQEIANQREIPGPLQAASLDIENIREQQQETLRLLQSKRKASDSDSDEESIHTVESDSERASSLPSEGHANRHRFYRQKRRVTYLSSDDEISPAKAPSASVPDDEHTNTSLSMPTFRK
jgi:cellulose biosynthesis protein BcsQ